MFSLTLTLFSALLCSFFYLPFSFPVWERSFPFHYLYPTSCPLTFLLLLWCTRFKCDALCDLTTGFIFSLIVSSHWTRVQVECWVAQSCPTLCDPMDCSPPGSSVHGALQARRTLARVAMPSSRGSPQLRDQTQVSRIAGGFFTTCATGEVSSSTGFYFSNFYGILQVLFPSPSDVVWGVVCSSGPFFFPESFFFFFSIYFY